MPYRIRFFKIFMVFSILLLPAPVRHFSNHPLYVQHLTNYCAYLILIVYFYILSNCELDNCELAQEGCQPKLLAA